jgi:hypothetical protein
MYVERLPDVPTHGEADKAERMVVIDALVRPPMAGLAVVTP